MLSSHKEKSANTCYQEMIPSQFCAHRVLMPPFLCIHGWMRTYTVLGYEYICLTYDGMVVQTFRTQS